MEVLKREAGSNPTKRIAEPKLSLKLANVNDKNILFIDLKQAVCL